MALLLASQSPRRRELMQLVTKDFDTCAADLDESAVKADTPAQLAQKLAAAKARHSRKGREGRAVIGCDTVVELDGRALGKPANAQEAADMIRDLAGKRHFVHTGVCIIQPGGHETSFVETSAVDFAAVPQHEIEQYAATLEPLDKAGAYGIQGWAAKYITRIEGCYYNIMGLPVSALYLKLKSIGEI